MRRILLIVALIVLVAAAVVWRVRTTHQQPAPAARRTAEAIPSIASQAKPARPVIFIGLDGADWSLLDQYIQQGTMPSLARLVREGVSGTVATLHPPLSPLVWTTMMTGVSPLEHRVLDFLRVNPSTHQREPITSDERVVPAIWNMATDGGKKVGALGFWATYPAEPVNGLIVSDRLFTFLYSESSPPPGVVYPQSLESWAADALRRAEHDADYEHLETLMPSLSEREYREAAAIADPYAHPVSALRRILIETNVYADLGRDWFAREKPDMLLVYIQGTDSIGHVFAPYAPPRQPNISESDYARYSEVPQRYFEHIDQLIEEYRKLAESSGGILMLASDHGFAWGEGRPTELSSVANATAARWHRENGIYLIWGNGIQPSDVSAPAHAPHGSVQQVCATLLALAGLPSGRQVAGPVLLGTPGTNANASVDYRQFYAKPVAPGASASPSGSRVDADTVAKLKALGYIGGAEDMSGRSEGTRTAGSLNNEGLLLKQANRTDEAIDAFDRAIALDPNLASALWNLSDLLFAQNRSLDKSDDLLVRAFAHGLPEGPKYLIGRAIGYQRSGQVDRSVRLLNMALAAKSDDPELLLFRGRYRVEQGDCASGLNDFRRATELSPSNAAAFASRGLAELCVGDRAAAQASLRRSLQLDPNQPKVRQYLQSSPTVR
jgi:Tfp pilus assembly protein PilF